jgi:hypothetical protein
MQTIDISELIKYEPSLSQNDWIQEQESTDVEIADVINAVIDNKLPQVATIFFLVDRGEFTVTQCAAFATAIGSKVVLPAAVEEAEAQELTPIEGEYTLLDMAEYLEDKHQFYTDYRPRSPELTIHSYICEHLASSSLLALMEPDDTTQEALRGTAGQAILFALKKIAKLSNVTLKMAFYHYSHNNEIDKVKKLLTHLLAVIALYPPSESDDYEISTDADQS